MTNHNAQHLHFVWIEIYGEGRAGDRREGEGKEGREEQKIFIKDMNKGMAGGENPSFEQKLS